MCIRDRLYPPKCPVTSTTSPIKNKFLCLFDIIVFEESSLVSTPPKVTSAVLYPSDPIGLINQEFIFSLTCFNILLDNSEIFPVTLFSLQII